MPLLPLPPPSFSSKQGCVALLIPSINAAVPPAEALPFTRRLLHLGKMAYFLLSNELPRDLFTKLQRTGDNSYLSN